MNIRKYYIVWNANRTEGFITDDYQLAYETRKSSDTNCYHIEEGVQCETAVAFCNEWSDDDCTIQEVEF